MKKIDIRKALLNLCMFLILLYPFNSSIIGVIYSNYFTLIGSILLGIIGILFLKKDLKLNKLSLLILSISCIVITITLFNNHYLNNRQELKVILFTLYLLLPFVTFVNEESIPAFCKIIKIFFAEHIIATFIAVFFKSFYKEHILSILCKGKNYCIAAGNYYHGYIPGITTHFSTNAIYLSISTIFLYSEYLTTKKKTTLIFLTLSLIALFTTGKRAHLIFTIFCCIILYLYNKRQNKVKDAKFIKLTLSSVLIISGLIILSNFIPEIMNVVNRFNSLIEEGNILNGRDNLYKLAISLWNNHLFFGSGWGAFSTAYQINMYRFGQVAFLDAHNVFLQLLCEVGLLGFIFFLSIMLTIFLKSTKIMKKTNPNEDNTNKIIKKFCFGYQLFFLLYCMTGNPLYDPQCYVIYFITIGYTCILIENEKKIRSNIYEKNRNSNISQNI